MEWHLYLQLRGKFRRLHGKLHVYPSQKKKKKKKLYYLYSKHSAGCQKDQTISFLKENFPDTTCQIYIELHSKHVKMTLECQIFVWKALNYAHHFPPLMRSLNHTPRRAITQLLYTPYISQGFLFSRISRVGC